VYQYKSVPTGVLRQCLQSFRPLGVLPHCWKYYSYLIHCTYNIFSMAQEHRNGSASSKLHRKCTALISRPTLTGKDRRKGNNYQRRRRWSASTSNGPPAQEQQRQGSARSGTRGKGPRPRMRSRKTTACTQCARGRPDQLEVDDGLHPERARRDELKSSARGRRRRGRAVGREEWNTGD
jgi:hypothetical protein